MRLTETQPLPWFVRRLGALLLAVASTAVSAQGLPPFETGTARCHDGLAAAARRRRAARRSAMSAPHHHDHTPARLLKHSVHLLFDGVPDSVDLRDVQALLEALPCVGRVHDLHVGAMGTSQIALTAHVVMPDCPADDAFFEVATQQLQQRFEIGHVTLQTVRRPFSRAC